MDSRRMDSRCMDEWIGGWVGGGDIECMGEIDECRTDKLVHAWWMEGFQSFS